MGLTRIQRFPVVCSVERGHPSLSYWSWRAEAWSWKNHRLLNSMIYFTGWTFTALQPKTCMSFTDLAPGRFIDRWLNIFPHIDESFKYLSPFCTTRFLQVLQQEHAWLHSKMRGGFSRQNSGRRRPVWTGEKKHNYTHVINNVLFTLCEVCSFAFVMQSSIFLSLNSNKRLFAGSHRFG